MEIEFRGGNTRLFREGVMGRKPATHVHGWRKENFGNKLVTCGLGLVRLFYNGPILNSL